MNLSNNGMQQEEMSVYYITKWVWKRTLSHKSYMEVIKRISNSSNRSYLKDKIFFFLNNSLKNELRKFPVYRLRMHLFSEILINFLWGIAFKIYRLYWFFFSGIKKLWILEYMFSNYSSLTMNARWIYPISI